MRGTRAGRGLAATVLLAMVAAGCTGDRPVDGDPTGPTLEPSASATHPGEAGRLRLRLERQFATFQHRMLEAGRAREADQETAAKAVSDAVGDLADTVAAVYDADAADDFESELTAWARRVQDHVRSDEDERSESRTALLKTADDVAEFMATVTDGEMEAEGTSALLREPLRATATSADAHADGNFDAAYLHHRLAYGDMVSAGQAFAAGITEQLPDRYSGPRSSGPLELHSALQQLLVEHALLAGAVTRRGAKGARDFDAAAAALNGNTEDLATAMESVYGSDTSALTGAWRDRISRLADYTVAVAEDKPQRRNKGRAEVHRADQRLGALLDDLSEGTIAARDATTAVRAVTQRLLAHVDAYVAKERAEAESAQAAAESAAAALAALLAEGIVAHRPDDFVSQ